jgi:predicted RNase H-like nuclease
MHLVGVDLAWGPRNRTGLAALDADGRLLDLRAAGGDDEILTWLGRYTVGPCLVAFDAPLIVTNPSGRRPCEAELSRDFGRFHAGTHPSNTARPEFADGSRALRLARALDLATAPDPTQQRRAIEVYPHPATIVLFGLTTTLKYKHKPGRTLDSLRAEASLLTRHLESLEHAEPPLYLTPHAGWREARAAVETATRKVDLKRVEDVVDAVLCAYIALYALRRPTDIVTYGDPAAGEIVTPRLRQPRV